MVGDLNGPGDYITLRKYTVKKFYLHAARLIFQKNFQCGGIGLLGGKKGRKSRKAVFARKNLMGAVFQLKAVAAVCVTNLNSLDSVVAIAFGCVFLGKHIQRKPTVIFCLVGVAGKPRSRFTIR